MAFILLILLCCFCLFSSLAVCFFLPFKRKSMMSLFLNLFGCFLCRRKEAENRSALIYFPNSLWQYCIWKVSCIRNITCYFYVSKHHRGRCVKYVWKRKLEDRSYRLSWIFLIRSLPDGGRNVCLLSY